MKISIALLIAVLIWQFPGRSSVRASQPTLPLHTSKREWRPLERRWDKNLQRKLENSLKRNELWRSLIEEKKMAVGVVDLSNPKAARFAHVNGETMMYAASLPKIAICLAAFQSFKDGVLHETPKIDRDLTNMIRLSDNQAASRMIDRIGLHRIQAVIMDPKYRFYDPQGSGGIWLGASYSGGGERIPDPIAGLSQAANVTQLCRFYYMLANGKLVSPKRSRQMLEIFSNPGLHDKFVSAMKETVPLDRLYRKSGEWSVWHSDSMLVWDEGWRRYILAAMVEDPRGEDVLKHLVPVVERILNPDKQKHHPKLL
jgi:beta-lactamase class A